METRKVDLGGGWEATIRRPGIHWNARIADVQKRIARQYGELPPEEIKEQGKEEPQLPDVITLHPEHYQFWEHELLPAALVGMSHLGKPVEQPHLADLGTVRFGKLLDAVMMFINSVEDSPFRGEGESPRPGDSAPSDEVSARVKARSARNPGR